MNIPEGIPKNTEQVSSKTFENYKSRLAHILIERGYSGTELAQNAIAKAYIENYVIENVINNSTKDSILGITHKLANMSIELSNAEQYSYPVIHTYKYHTLTHTTIFCKKDGACVHEVIPIEKPKIIIT